MASRPRPVKTKAKESAVSLKHNNETVNRKQPIQRGSLNDSCTCMTAAKEQDRPLCMLGHKGRRNTPSVITVKVPFSLVVNLTLLIGQ